MPALRQRPLARHARLIRRQTRNQRLRDRVPTLPGLAEQTLQYLVLVRDGAGIKNQRDHGPCNETQNLILKQKLESIKVQDIAVCSIVKSELFYGALKSAKPERNLAAQQEFLAQFISLPFDDSATMIFGTIRT